MFGLLVLEFALACVVAFALFFGGRAGFEGGGVAVFAAGEVACLLVLMIIVLRIVVIVVLLVLVLLMMGDAAGLDGGFDWCVTIIQMIGGTTNAMVAQS